jgi:hypothetical protein
MKGIFCLEGFWYGDHRDEASVSPVLDLIKLYNNSPVIHHRCGTREEFLYGIKRWTTKSFHKKYPILYLAFHGQPGEVLVGDEAVDLEDLSRLLEGHAKGTVIYFGSCSTLDVDGKRLQAFMKQSGAQAIFGYREDVDWLPSASFEIMLMSQLSSHPFTKAGVSVIKRELDKICRGYLEKLEFTMVVKKKVAKKKPVRIER